MGQPTRPLSETRSSIATLSRCDGPTPSAGALAPLRASSPPTVAESPCPRIATTRPRFGGLRWWFVCPLTVNGRPCGRRVGKLYLPPAGRYFGCRHCHDLTYTSCQTHDKRVDFLRNDPAELLRAAENLERASPAELIRLLKALPV
jgi:hypothetical protein